MTDTIQNQPKTRRDAIEMDNVRSQKANLKKNTDANQLLSLRKKTGRASAHRTTAARKLGGHEPHTTEHGPGRIVSRLQ